MPLDQVNFDSVLNLVYQECREQEIPMLGPEKAQFLAELIGSIRPNLVVECGTAIGYSGLWIARELKKANKGKLITIELDPDRAQQAKSNFEQAGVGDFVEQRVGNAEYILSTLAPSLTVDLIHFDNEFDNYYSCFRAVERNLVDGSILLADNVGIGADQMEDYLNLVRSDFVSRTEWFEVDLPWIKQDAMELSTYRSGLIKNSVSPSD